MASLDPGTASISRVEDWALFLVNIEGFVVVEEPNGKFSRMGVSVDTEGEAESLTFDDFIKVVRRTNYDAFQAFGQHLPVESYEYFVLRDLMWLAGPKTAIRGLEAHLRGEPVLVFAVKYLVGLSSKPRFAQYRNGWITRLRRLNYVYYAIP